MTFLKFKKYSFHLVLVLFSLMVSCKNEKQLNVIVKNSNSAIIQKPIIGANQVNAYLPLLKGKTIMKREALYWHYPHYGN